MPLGLPCTDCASLCEARGSLVFTSCTAAGWLKQLSTEAQTGRSWLPATCCSHSSASTHHTRWVPAETALQAAMFHVQQGCACSEHLCACALASCSCVYWLLCALLLASETDCALTSLWSAVPLSPPTPRTCLSHPCSRLQSYGVHVSLTLVLCSHATRMHSLKHQCVAAAAAAAEALPCSSTGAHVLLRSHNAL